MASDPQEAKRRFDDVYRALLVIGPILSFSFSNYSLSQNMITFIYVAGFPALITAVLLWAFSNLMNKSWEYQVKFIGYALIWFACTILFTIVYTHGDPAHSFWYWAGICVTVIVVYLTGNIFVNNNIISRNYSIMIVILSILLGVVPAIWIKL